MQKNKLLQKTLAMFLIFVLTFADFALVTKSYAASLAETLFGTSSDTGHENVEFDAFFGSEEDKQKEIVSDVNNKDLAIKFNLNVLNEGYLKNAEIEILESDSGKGLNFEIGKNGILENSERIKSGEETKISETESAEKPAQDNTQDGNVVQENGQEENLKNSSDERIAQAVDLQEETKEDVSTMPNEENKQNESEENNQNLQEENSNKTLENDELADKNLEQPENEINKESKENISQGEISEQSEKVSGENSEQQEISDDSSRAEQNDGENSQEGKPEEENVENTEKTSEENSDEKIEQTEESVEETNEETLEKTEEIANQEESETEIEFPEYVQCLEENNLILNQIDSTSNVKIDLPIKYKNEAYVSKDIVGNNCKIIFTGIYVDGEGNEVAVEKEETLTVNWTDERELEVETGTTKYIDFGKGIILQTIIKTDGSEDGNRLPIKSSEINVEVPELGGIKPSSVLVVANSLEGTNGEKIGEINFDESNWFYNENDNRINIKVQNIEKFVKESDFNEDYLKDEEETVEERLYNGNGIDEYLVTYTYQDLDIASVEDSMISNIDANLTLVNGEKVTNNNFYQYGLGESQGNVVSLKLSSETEEISKAYSYINYKLPGKYETEIAENTVINVSYKDIVKDLKVEDVQNLYVNKDGSEVETEDIYYKRIEVSKETFDKILGETGEIRVKDLEGNEVGIINSESEVNDAGNIGLNIDGRYSKLAYEVSKPVSEGNLIIKSIKALGNLNIDKASLMNMSKIRTKSVLKADFDYVEGQVEVETKEADVDFIDTKTEAKLILDRESLSTLSLNENVEMRIELNNANIKSDIYGHSVFEIELPEYIESLNITNTNIVFGEGLNITEIVAQGRTIRITLDGVQEGINTGILSNGTNIVINADIKVNLYSPAKSEKVKLRYTNDEATNYANNGEDEFEIKYSAPTGLVAVNSITGYKEGAKVESIRQGKKTDYIDIYSDPKIATEELIIMNNFGNKISNISILGRFPFKDVKDILSGDNLGTTLTPRIITGITADGRNREGFKVYYSEKGDATEDLTDELNGWKENPENMENMKSYLIVPVDENYEMEDIEVLRFTYQYEVPGNLNHNENIFATFMVNYQNNNDELGMEENEIADLVGITTGEGPELDVEIIPNKEEVKEYEELEYTIKIKNIGKTPVQDIVANFSIPNEAEYVSYEVVSGNANVSYDIMNGQLIIISEKLDIEKFLEAKLVVKIKKVRMLEVSITEDWNAEIKRLEEFPERYIELTGSITAKELNKILEIKSKQSRIKQANFKIEEEKIAIVDEVYAVGTEMNFKIAVTNTLPNYQNDIIVTQEIPKELEYIESSITEYDVNNKSYETKSFGTYDENSKTIMWKIPKLIGNNDVKEFGENKVYFNYKVKIVDFDDGDILKIIKLKASVKSNESEPYESNEVSVEIGRPVLRVTQTADNNNTYIKPGDIIKYLFLIKNEGGAKATNIKFSDVIPEGMIVERVTYFDAMGMINDQTSSNDEASIQEMELNPGEEIKAEVELRVSDENVSAQLTVSNYGTLIADEVNQIKTNSITHIVEVKGDEKGDGEESSIIDSTNNEYDEEGNIVQTYKIEGTVWEDKNKNGKRDSDEELLEDIVVKLINSDNGAVQKASYTDSLGEYVLDGIPNGNYMVIFEFDTDKYMVTTYHKEGVASNANSDAISTKIEQEGKSKMGAITDVIKIANQSIYDVDLGLTLVQVFDLKVDKTITKITAQTNKGVETKNYDSVKLAKTEIASKNVSGAVVFVEYEIKISNIGDIEGYAKKIIDYIPEDMKFNSSIEANSNWYTGSDGNLYSTTLENVRLTKGESKTIKLVLTKNMTTENTGISNNQAEIFEDYNIYGILDTNSIPGNKVQNENDISSADSVILIKTGETFIYISIIITTMLLGIIAGLIVYNQIESRKRKVGV